MIHIVLSEVSRALLLLVGLLTAYFAGWVLIAALLLANRLSSIVLPAFLTFRNTPDIPAWYYHGWWHEEPGNLVWD